PSAPRRAPVPGEHRFIVRVPRASHLPRHLGSGLEPRFFNSLHSLCESFFRRTHRHPDIPLARRAESIARSRHDPGRLEQVSCEGSGRISIRYGYPDIECGRREIDFQAEFLQAWYQRVASLLIDRSNAVSQGIIQPQRRDPGGLYRLEHARVQIAFYLTES